MRWIWSDQLAEALSALGVEADEEMRRAPYGLPLPEGLDALLAAVRDGTRRQPTDPRPSAIGDGATRDGADRR